MNCSVFKRDLYHFQADELPAAERAAYIEHAGACAQCAALMEVEEGLLRGLKIRLTPGPLPPGLETRIREQLRRSTRSSRPGLDWVRKPWFAAIAASTLLAVLVLPNNLRPSPSPARSLAPVSRVVTVVDFNCDRAGRPYEQQRLCADHTHLNALKLEEGGYWQIGSDRQAGRELITDRAIRGARMRVEGLFFERTRTLHVERAAEFGVEAASLSSSGY